MSAYGLEGRTAVVTGANGGIGRAICQTLAGQGASIIACVRRPEPDFEAWLAELAGPGSARCVALDLVDEDSIKAAVKSLRGMADAVDVLVNNAGRPQGGLFQMTRMSDLRAAFEVNFFGPLVLTQGVARLMQRRGAGSIINISSAFAQRADPGTLAYGASKAALERATRSLAVELGPVGIRVNAVAPGVTRTAMADQMDPEARQHMLEATALRREARPADVANAVLFLASDQSAQISGDILHVNGGLA